MFPKNMHKNKKFIFYSHNLISIFRKILNTQSISDAKWATAGLMLFNVLCSAFAVWLGHRPWVGRRRMVLTGLSGCCYVMLLLFILLKLLDCTIPDFPRKPTNYFAIGLLILYILFFNGGPSGLSNILGILRSKKFFL